MATQTLAMHVRPLKTACWDQACCRCENRVHCWRECGHITAGANMDAGAKTDRQRTGLKDQAQCE